METRHANGPMIEVRDLRKSYGDLEAVAGVSFSVAPGEVFGILGPNGAGKTTTVEVLEGMRPPDGGTAFVNGIDVRRDPQRVKSIIGVQLQSSVFFDKLSLSEILKVFGSFYGRRVDTAALLDQVGLEDKVKSTYTQLSGGQKQRFSIAVALVNDPLVLFLDEPTTGLDPQARRPRLGPGEAVQVGGPHDTADHSLHGGGRGAVRPDRHHGRRQDHRPRRAGLADR